MKYLSIDIETTGLDYENDMILEFAAVFVDTSIEMEVKHRPFLKRVVYQPGNLTGSPYALSLNKRLLDEYAEIERDKNKKNYVYLDMLYMEFRRFLLSCGYEFEKVDDFRKSDDNEAHGKTKIIIAGKNYAGFDSLFLKRVPKWNDNFISSSRVIDPAIYYTDFNNDNDLPSMIECMKRCPRFFSPMVTHDALDDARTVVDLLEAVRLGEVPQPYSKK